MIGSIDPVLLIAALITASTPIMLAAIGSWWSRRPAC